MEKRSRTPKRVREALPPPLRSGRLMGAEEKRQLILAHAAMRHPQDPAHMLSLWAGVVLAAVVVIGGWAWAVSPQIFHSGGSLGQETRKITDGAMSAIQRERQALDTSPIAQDISRLSATLNVQQARAASEEAAINSLAAMVSATSSRTTTTTHK